MAFFKFMAEWGIWDIIAIIGAAVPIILVLRYIFPRKAIKNLYINTVRDFINQDYPKVVRINLKNLTNEPIYVISEGFYFGTAISAAANAAKNAATKAFEVKFEGRQQGCLLEIDTLIRPGQEVSTWIPVDPSQSDNDVDDAIRSRKVGELRLKCQRLSGRRDAPIKLWVPV